MNKYVKETMLIYQTLVLTAIFLTTQGLPSHKPANHVLNFHKKNHSRPDRASKTLQIPAPLRARRPRNQHSSTEHSCSQVKTFGVNDMHKIRKNPNGKHRKKLQNFYKKYTEAYGLLVMGSNAVRDDALKRACYVLRFLLADRKDIRHEFNKQGGRLVVLAKNEFLINTPEWKSQFKSLAPGPLRRKMWKALRRQQYFASNNIVPVTYTAENNLLCHGSSKNTDDLTLKYLAISILNLAVSNVEQSFEQKLDMAYKHALLSGSWKNTDAASSFLEYFGEGTQSYYNANSYAKPADGKSNNINTRVKLRSYDPSLFVLVHQIFPCANNFAGRCHSRKNEAFLRLEMDCPIHIWSRKDD